MNRQGDLYGDDRLMAVLQRTSGTPQDLVDAVLADVAVFQDGAPQTDDQTLLCLRRCR